MPGSNLLYYRPLGGTVGRWHSRFRRRRESVRVDWRACLPSEKGSLFGESVAELESLYAMLSITLDEALGLCARGRQTLGCDEAEICADLFDRLAERLRASLGALEEHGRHFGTSPQVAPLETEFFHSPTAQRIARNNSLLSKVLFSQRSSFFHKLRSLAEIVEDVQVEFREYAEEIADGSASRPGTNWEALDVLHYDLNTCLRETTVLLKSFLCALPSREVQPFRLKLLAVSPAPAPVHPRRTAIFRRE